MAEFQEAVGVIRKSGSRWCLFFSDGRKQCFSSRKQAEKREQQVNYFKHKNASNSFSGEDLYAMAHLDIYAVHNKGDSNETVFFISEENGIKAYLIKGSEDSGEMELFQLDNDYENIQEYQDIINDAMISFTKGSKDSMVKLTEPIIENQLISGGHSHTIDVSSIDFPAGSSWGMGKTSENDGHFHYVDVYKDGGNYFIASAPLKIGNLTLSHTHLIKIDLGG